LIKNTLTGKQKRFLRSLGMTLEPIVPIGKEGITPAVVNSADEAIEKRELIKVRVLQNCPEDIEVAITNCDLVQIIGRNGLLWRRNFKKPKIELPK
jgi:RNA-binding protein